MSEIKPAMTPEQWKEVLADTLVDQVEQMHSAMTGTDVRHACAARDLHGQPFGFTWDDVDFLREAARTWYYTDSDDRPQPILDSLADRIAALLPPRDGAK